MPINAADIIGLQDFISGNDEVLEASALRHEQVHSFTSAADHQDVSGENAEEGETMYYNSVTGKWEPRTLVIQLVGDIDEGTC